MFDKAAQNRGDEEMPAGDVPEMTYPDPEGLAALHAALRCV